MKVEVNTSVCKNLGTTVVLRSCDDSPMKINYFDRFYICFDAIKKFIFWFIDKIILKNIFSVKFDLWIIFKTFLLIIFKIFYISFLKLKNFMLIHIYIFHINQKIFCISRPWLIKVFCSLWKYFLNWRTSVLYILIFSKTTKICFMSIEYGEKLLRKVFENRLSILLFN